MIYTQSLMCLLFNAVATFKQLLQNSHQDEMNVNMWKPPNKRRFHLSFNSIKLNSDAFQFELCVSSTDMFSLV